LTRIIKVGIIGAGIISQFHGPAYVGLDGVKLEAVCDVNVVLAEKRAQDWGAPLVFSDYREMLKNKEISAVEVLLPHHLHKKVTIDAIEAGKHVSVQKPMALHPDDAREMIRSAKSQNVILNVAENYLFHENVTKAIDLVSSGDLGKPILIRFGRIPCSGGGENYREPSYPDYWRKSKGLSGGMVFDDMVHYDALARFLMRSDIESLSAILNDPKSSAEIPAVVSWKHSGGPAFGSLTYSTRTRIPVQSEYTGTYESLEIVCEEGILRVPNLSARLTAEPPLILYGRDGKLKEFSELNSDYAYSFRKEVAHFVHCMKTGTKPMFDGEEGLKEVLFATAIQKSADNESRVTSLSEL